MDLVAESVTGVVPPELNVRPILWGKRHEPAARANYGWVIGVPVVKCEFVQHPKYTLVGGSPDSFVGDDGLLEIKCPYTTKVHLNTLLTNTIPPEYRWQIQGNLWVTGRQWCDFVSYDPRCPAGVDMVVIRAERAEDEIDELEEKVVKFIEQLELKLARVKSHERVASE
jgi:predicted phage-related endonuclease